MVNSMAVKAVAANHDAVAGARQIVSCPGNAFVTRVSLVGGQVYDVWSTGRMMRNMDVLLKGQLDADGRPDFLHQAHCLCNDGHALAAIRAVENLAGITVPHSAVLVRRLVQSLRCIQEHLLHFYQFHFSDWVSSGKALRADPAKAAALAALPGHDTAHFRAVKDRLRVMAEARGGNEPESAYPGPDELHLLLSGHAQESIRVGSCLQSALKLLGCSPKGFKAYRIGGLSSDLNLRTENLNRLRSVLDECRYFICTVFPDDLGRLAMAYSPFAGLGAGKAFLTWDDAMGGRIISSMDNVDAWSMTEPEQASIHEEQEPVWRGTDRRHYRLLAENNEPLFRWSKGTYSWLSAPRHSGMACEVGPVARVMGGWLSGDCEIDRALSAMLDQCGLTPGGLNSTMGRLLSRGVESAALMQAAFVLLDELGRALSGEKSHSVEFDLPISGIGHGRVEVSRGTLIHSIRWGEGRILKHDYLIPSLWNFSPRDSRGEPGPLERALIGTPVADADQPVEILRTLHELNPCNVCHLVVDDRDTGRISLATA